MLSNLLNPIWITDSGGIKTLQIRTCYSHLTFVICLIAHKSQELHPLLKKSEHTLANTVVKKNYGASWQSKHILLPGSSRQLLRWSFGIWRHNSQSNHDWDILELGIKYAPGVRSIQRQGLSSRVFLLGWVGTATKNILKSISKQLYIYLLLRTQYGLLTMGNMKDYRTKHLFSQGILEWNWPHYLCY